MRYPKVRIGLYQRLVQHLLLLVGHIRDQQAKKDHKLLDLAGQHGVGVIVVDFIDQLHLRGRCLSDRHDVYAILRACADADEGSADGVAGPAELMTLYGCEYKALYAAHPHPQRQELHQVRFARAACSEYSQVGVFIDGSIEEVDYAQRMIVAVDPQKHAVVVAHFKAREHVRRRSAAGQHVTLGFPLQPRIDGQKRHDRLQRRLLLKIAVVRVHVHAL